MTFFMVIKEYIKEHNLTEDEVISALELFVKYYRDVHKYVTEVFKQPIEFDKMKHF